MTAVKQACNYCTRYAVAYLSRSYRLGAPPNDEPAPRHACHQHIGRGLEELAWNAKLRRVIGVFVVPMGPLEERVRVHHES